MADNYHGVTRDNACLNLMADGPPLHHASGVRYHIVAACSGTLRCAGGAMVDAAGKPVKVRKAWKANFNDDLDLDRALPRVLEIARNGAAANDTLVAPFSFACAPALR